MGNVQVLNETNSDINVGISQAGVTDGYENNLKPGDVYETNFKCTTHFGVYARIRRGPNDDINGLTVL
jgi:hypothetical protein